MADRIRQNIDLQMRIQRRTRTQLGAVLSISPQSAARRLDGQIDITVNELETIAGWLGISMARLLGVDPEPALEGTPYAALYRAPSSGAAADVTPLGL